MKRRVFIIGAPLDRFDVKNRSFYNGVMADIRNFQNFFHSSLGGGFYAKEEVITLINQTWANIKYALSTNPADYTVVVFSGHGYTQQPSDQFRMNINATQDPSLGQIVAQIRSRKILFVIDACRTFVEDHTPRYFHADGLGDPDDVMRFPSNISIPEARMILENRVRIVEEGIQVLYSSSPNEYSALTTRGSYFSKSLLQSAKNWSQKNDGSNILLGVGAFKMATREIKKLTQIQNPIMKWDHGANFPFAIKKHVRVPVFANGFYR